MNDSKKTVLEEALPSASAIIVEAMIPEVWLSVHRDDFVTLFLESYRAYLSGCPRASIIVAGECLLRAVFARIESEIVLRRAPLSVGTGKKKKTISIYFDAINVDLLSFCEALDLLKQNQLLSDSALDIAYTVKELRNRTAHGQLPLLDNWDSDEPRVPGSPEHKRMLWDESFAFPEGYRFIPSKDKKKGNWFTFDCRKHHCGSLKRLGVEERFAAIQYSLVVDALLRMFKESIRPGDRVRKKTQGTEGTVLESHAFSRIYRSVKWDEGEVQHKVVISDIEKVL
jgi:hypothetical protein